MYRYHITINIILLLCFIFATVMAEDAEEEIFSLEDETSEGSELIEFLQQLKHEPLLINSASKEDLEQLLWLNEADIKIILELRKKQVITSSSDLVESGLNRLTVNAILPYLSFKQKMESSIFQQSRSSYKKVKDYFPSTLNYYQKTLVKLGRFQAGFVSQKDEGESDPLDFYSAFLNYQSRGLVKQVILGHYRIGLGQGILFAPKLGMSKSAAATSIPIKRLPTLKPYTSSYEIWDLRGAAAILKSRNYELTSFYSNNDLAANITDNKVTSFNLSGVHLSKPDYVKEEVVGASISYNSNNLDIGLSATQISFDHEFSDPNLKQKYEAFSLNGKTNYYNIPTFWEVATASQKYAAVGGFKWGNEVVRHLFLIRYYEKDFPTWHGKPFSAQSNFDNELGCYFGSTITPVRNLKLNIYFDVWKYPESRYFEKLPTSGSEEFFQLELNRKPQNLRFSLRHKSVDKYSSLNEESLIRPLERTVLRLDWWQKIKLFRFKTRVEFAQEDLDETINKGWLCYEELKLKSMKWSIILNYTVYSSQVLHYMYENGVDGVMQNSILSGDGSYSYLLLEHDFSDNFTIQGKVGGKPVEEETLAVYLQIISRF